MLRSILFAKVPIIEQAYLESLQSKPEITLPTKTKLRDLWIQDPSAKHGIDLLVELINRGFKLESEDFNVQTDLSLMDRNTDITDFNDALTRDAIIFGTAFGEYLYNKKKSKVLGLWNMDPTKTDFVRDANKSIMLMDSTKPKGYIQEVGFMQDDSKKQIEGTAAGQRGIIFGSSKVFHFSFETFSGTIEGISALQTIVDTLENKIEAEKGVKEAIKRFGTPILKVTTGDARHISTPESLKKTRKKLEGIAKKSVIITPEWQKIDILQPKQIAKISDNLNYYNAQVPIGLGIPKALILETGEATNRATLRQQIRLLIARIYKKRERSRDFWNKTLLPFIGSINKWKELPKPTWKPMTLEDVESLAKRVTMYVKEGIISPEEAKKKIERAESL